MLIRSDLSSSTASRSCLSDPAPSPDPCGASDNNVDKNNYASALDLSSSTANRSDCGSRASPKRQISYPTCYDLSSSAASRSGNNNSASGIDHCGSSASNADNSSGTSALGLCSSTANRPDGGSRTSPKRLCLAELVECNVSRPWLELPPAAGASLDTEGGPKYTLREPVGLPLSRLSPTDDATPKEDLFEPGAECPDEEDLFVTPVPRTGDTVLVHGLAKARHLNNLLGCVLGFDEHSGRFMIRFASEVTPSKIKPCNLMFPAVCPHCSSEVTGSRCFACPAGEPLMHDPICCKPKDNPSIHSMHISQTDSYLPSPRPLPGPGTRRGTPSTLQCNHADGKAPSWHKYSSHVP